MTKTPVVFFGTHQFAATILEGLIKSPFYDIQLVITQPDRPVGRKQELQPSPVKLLAQKHNLPIDQPSSLKSYKLKAISYKLGIVAQYGLLIPKHILEAFPLGILNVHTSLLPKYRGASPIQSALINGETETGVTIMKMDEGLDTGSIILQKKVAINPDDTYLDLDKKLAVLGIEALTEALPRFIDGTLKPRPQDTTKATVCRELTREDGRVDWQKTSQEIYNQYRGLTPWPGIWTTWHNKRLKLLSIKLAPQEIESGKVIVEAGKLFIGCHDGSIEVFELQLEGKKAMEIKAFINGNREVNHSFLP
ncbi:MAG: methionyl-tRNA formyltransferase [Patescibacteria group bacterium]